MHRTREITREFQEIPQAGTTSHRVKIRGFARYLIKNSEGSSPETLSIWILFIGTHHLRFTPHSGYRFWDVDFSADDFGRNHFKFLFTFNTYFGYLFAPPVNIHSSNLYYFVGGIEKQIQGYYVCGARGGKWISQHTQHLFGIFAK